MYCVNPTGWPVPKNNYHFDLFSNPPAPHILSPTSLPFRLIVRAGIIWTFGYLYIWTCNLYVFEAIPESLSDIEFHFGVTLDVREPFEHCLTDDEDIFSKMGGSRMNGKYHGSNSDAEIEYRRGRSLRESRGNSKWPWKGEEKFNCIVGFCMYLLMCLLYLFPPSSRKKALVDACVVYYMLFLLFLGVTIMYLVNVHLVKTNEMGVTILWRIGAGAQYHLQCLIAKCSSHDSLP